MLCCAVLCCVVQGMTYQSYLNTGGADTYGNTLGSVKDPTFANMVPFGFCISFLGIFCNLILRKVCGPVRACERAPDNSAGMIVCLSVCL
jgi:hypothetical protein